MTNQLPLPDKDITVKHAEEHEVDLRIDREFLKLNSPHMFLPRYSSYFNVARRVLDKLKEDNWTLDISWEKPYYDEEDQYPEGSYVFHVEVNRYSDNETIPYYHWKYDVSHLSLPMAICLAALQTLRNDPHEIGYIDDDEETGNEDSRENNEGGEEIPQPDN